MSSEKTHPWHNLTIDKIARELKTDLEKGLDEKEVEVRQKFGRNVLPEERPLSRLRILLEQFKSPLIYILLVAGVVTLALEEFTDSTIILAAVFLNAAVGFFQEFKASNTLRELKKVLKVKAVVVREGMEREVTQENLVPGDIIVLKAGDKVPSDARVIKAWNLKTNEAPLTGEWLAAEKKAGVLPEATPLADRDNMVYMSSIVEEGEGKAVVVSVGEKTEIGKVASMIKQTKEEKTPYQKKLARFSKIISIIIAGVCAFIFIEGLITGRAFVEMFVTAVAVAVAAIPEGLPVAMTVILALGMQRILKRKGLVRKLASAETLGSTSIIATDKTLTLTEGKMALAKISAADENLALEIAVLANEALVENPQSNYKRWHIIGRPTDKAFIEGAAQKGILRPSLEKAFQKIDEVPFNTKNKFIASLLEQDKKRVLYVSGAPEKVISLSSKIKSKTGIHRITKKTLLDLNKTLEDLTGQGLRVVAVSYKPVRGSKLETENLEQVVNNLVFSGFIGLKDPLRKEAKEAFRICQKAGMKPIIVTGDHLLTARAVAKELGLEVKKDNIMLGVELDELSPRQLERQLNKINVFARVEPQHKLRIIEAWQKKNKVVAMTGDGINDAPALKKADIGVALGSGTEVAKEASDLVLINDNFSIIVSAVEEGRAILDNIRKVITYLLSDSFTEVILIGVCIFAKLPLPITAAQILWVNLLEDGFPNLALAFEKKEKDLMDQKPVPHDSPLLTKEMKTIIFIIGIFTDLLLLGLFLWLYSKYGEVRIDYIRTMLFAGLTIDSLFYVFSCKSLRKNIWKINIFSNKFLVMAWATGFIFLTLALYMPFLQGLLKTVSLSAGDWLILLGVGVANLILIEAAKFYFIARHETA